MGGRQTGQTGTRMREDGWGRGGGKEGRMARRGGVAPPPEWGKEGENSGGAELFLSDSGGRRRVSRMERPGGRWAVAGTFMDLTDTEKMDMTARGAGDRRKPGTRAGHPVVRIFCKMKSVSGNLRTFHDRASHAKGARVSARFLRVSVGLSQGLRWSRAEARFFPVRARRRPRKSQGPVEMER